MGENVPRRMVLEVYHNNNNNRNNDNYASISSVTELLSKDNYESWSVIMKSYLKSKDLWDGVVSGYDGVGEQRNDANWKKKNANALHAIQLSCGPDILSVIRTTDYAKDAWSHLNCLFSPDLKGKPDAEQGVGKKALHQHVMRGEWTAATSIIMKDDKAVFECNSSGKTVLHIAVIAGNEDIVRWLVNKQEERLLVMQDNYGYTALALVALLNGNAKMAESMVEAWSMAEGNQDLLTMSTNDDQIPILLASAAGHKELTRYLYKKTHESVLAHDDWRYGIVLLTQCITAEIFDVALKLLQKSIPLRGPPANFKCKVRWTPLFALARMPSVFLSGCQLSWWQRIIYQILIIPQDQDPQGEGQENAGEWIQRIPMGECQRVRMDIQDTVLKKIRVIKQIYDKKLTHDKLRQILKCLQGKICDLNDDELVHISAYDAMLQAAKYGIEEFIETMMKANLDLLWAIDNINRGVFSHAILNRQENVLNILKNESIDGRVKRIASRPDEFDNNMLHLAAELGPSSDLARRSGAALQMQREIQWFKMVEKIVNSVDPKCQEERNADDKKPREVFTKSHEELVKEGAKWAKETATSFTIVCTLIITIMFAAAFTVPGGNDQQTGFPIFLNKTLFEVFALADAISLVSSSSSVLISIGILTSRYAEQDFHRTLPLMLLFDLFFLFSSVVAMMVAFCAGIAMMLKGYQKAVIGAMSLAGIPVGAFMFTQLSLFKEIYMSTIGLGWFEFVFKFINKMFRYVSIYLIFWPIIIFIYIIKKIMDYCWNFVIGAWNPLIAKCSDWAAKIREGSAKCFEWAAKIREGSAKCFKWAAAKTRMPSTGCCRC